MDPPFTRIIKIDILTSLALEPASIEAVLKELRTYIRDSDKLFVCATLRAVGKVAELSRIVYDRHGQRSGDMVKARKTANRIALDCLHGLCVMTQSCDRPGVTGECVCVMQSLMLLLRADAGQPGGLMNVEDPNEVQSFALRRMLLLLVKSLSARIQKVKDGEAGSDDEEENAVEQSLRRISLALPPRAVASALWMVGEWLSMPTVSPTILRNLDDARKANMRLELARILARTYPDLNPLEKEQGIHFASKLLLSSAAGVVPVSSPSSALCELILSMGRVDVNPDVRDRARFESAVLHATVGLQHDADALETVPPLRRAMTLENAKKIIFASKPAPSYLPVDGDSTTNNTSTFRFGTLSSLVGHKARGAYLPLPPWGEQNSPSTIRDPGGTSTSPTIAGFKDGDPKASKASSASGFYADEEGANASDESDDSSSDSSSSSESSDDDSDASSDDSSSDSSAVNAKSAAGGAKPGALPAMNGGGQSNIIYMNPAQPMAFPPPVPQFQHQASSQPSSDDENSDGSDDSSTSSSSSSSGADDSPNSDSEKESQTKSTGEGTLLSMMGGEGGGLSNFATVSEPHNGSGSAMDDLRGLVMAPIVVDEAEPSDPNIENDSSTWMQLVRPEHCGGLSVKARYLRGPTKVREARLQGLDPASAALICLQVQLGNK
jgi:AP-3 complex subunit beta